MIPRGAQLSLAKATSVCPEKRRLAGLLIAGPLLPGSLCHASPNCGYRQPSFRVIRRAKPPQGPRRPIVLIVWAEDIPGRLSIPLLARQYLCLGRLRGVRITGPDFVDEFLRPLCVSPFTVEPAEEVVVVGCPGVALGRAIEGLCFLFTIGNEAGSLQIQVGRTQQYVVVFQICRE